MRSASGQTYPNGVWMHMKNLFKTAYVASFCLASDGLSRPRRSFTLRKSIWTGGSPGPVFERDGSVVQGVLDLDSMPVLTQCTCPGRSASHVRWRDTRVTRFQRHRAPMWKHCGNTFTSEISEWAAGKMLELWNIYTRHACVSSRMSSTVYWRRTISSLESFSIHGKKRSSDVKGRAERTPISCEITFIIFIKPLKDFIKHVWLLIK